MKIYGGKCASGSRRHLAAVIALVLVLGLAVGGTIAYLSMQTPGIKNIFTPATVTVDTHEDFDGAIKKNLYVENNGDTAVYIRVKLVTYMQDETGAPTGVQATIPALVAENWFYVESEDCYYYSKPVTAKAETTHLISSDGITLVSGQVVDVLVEGIQAEPATAVKEAWKVSVAEDGTISK